MHFRSICDLSKLLRRNLWRIPVDTEVLAGVPRSGAIAAYMLGTQLHLPVTTVDAVCAQAPVNGGRRLRVRSKDRVRLLQKPRRVLVVDDTVRGGGTLNWVRAMLSSCAIAHRYTYLGLYVTEKAKKFVDIWFECLGTPRCFEWNWVDDPFLRNACVDIDGVLCPDPLPTACDEDGPGRKYQEFITSAPLLYRIRFGIGALVTCRLSRWRGQTANWLRLHGIKYKELVMMPQATARERRAYGHVRYKAEFYRNSVYTNFVESNRNQAQKIFQSTGKPVFCPTSMEWFQK